ncbi:MAG: DUF3015 family protein [Nitrospiraceae bacterium]
MQCSNRLAPLLFSAALLMLTLPACTTKGLIKATTDPTTDILSSTSGAAWFTEDGIVKDEFKVDAFTAFNFENVKQDMSQGRGEYLTSLGSLLGVPEERQATFFQLMREKYSVLVPTDRTTPAELVAALHDERAADPRLNVSHTGR